MSDLEQTRNHARKMSESAHLYGCYGKAHNRIPPRPGRPLGVKDCRDDDPHEAHVWAMTLSNGVDTIHGGSVRCRGICGGCMTDRARAMWKRIADELDAYLSPDDGQEALL